MLILEKSIGLPTQLEKVRLLTASLCKVTEILFLSDSRSASIWSSGTAGVGCAPYSLKVRDVVKLHLVDCNGPSTAMTHIAIQEKLNGSPVSWMERVTDEQYRK